MASIVLILVLYVLTVARVTRLLTADKFFAWWRNWLILTFGAESMFVYAWFCRWCMGVWVAFAVAPAAIILTGLTWWLLPFIALTGSHITGLLVKLEASE